MKASQTIISTLRDSPSDAVIESHKLMMRAGLIRKLANGLYAYMPLGLRALRKAEAGEWLLIDPETGALRPWAFDGHPCVLYSSMPLESGSLVRIRDETYVPERFGESKR